MQGKASVDYFFIAVYKFLVKLLSNNNFSNLVIFFFKKLKKKSFVTIETLKNIYSRHRKFYRIYVFLKNKNSGSSRQFSMIQTIFQKLPSLNFYSNTNSFVCKPPTKLSKQLSYLQCTQKASNQQPSPNDSPH